MEKRAFNNKVKTSLMMEDVALGCWAEEGVWLEGIDNEVEEFHPNEQGGNDLDTDEYKYAVRDLQQLVTYDTVLHEFWTSLLVKELNRIFESNPILAVNEINTTMQNKVNNDRTV